jgi:two-component system, OmpR family, response regulator
MYTPHHILVVDDSPLIRDMVAHALRFAGYRVVEAQNVAGALEVLRERTQLVHAVISDVEMPGFSVRTLIEELRRVEPSIPILLMSDAVYDDKIRQMVDAGEVPLLRKPFGWDELIRSIRWLLETPR